MVSKVSHRPVSARIKGLGSRTNPRVVETIEALAWDGYGPAAILKEVQEEFGEGCVSLSLLKAIVKEVPRDPTAPWSLYLAEPEEAALVLPVLQAVITRSAGEHVLTIGEAGWVARVRRAAPDLPPYAAFELARWYYRRSEIGHPVSDDMDALLAYAPWRSPEAWKRYQDALEAQWIPVVGLPWVLARSHTAMLEALEGERK